MSRTAATVQLMTERIQARMASSRPRKPGRSGPRKTPGMETMEILANEHGLIRQFFDNLSLVRQKLEEGSYPSRSCLENGIEFVRCFADKCHHFKEKQILFLRLAQKQPGQSER